MSDDDVRLAWEAYTKACGDKQEFADWACTAVPALFREIGRLRSLCKELGVAP